MGREDKRRRRQARQDRTRRRGAGSDGRETVSDGLPFEATFTVPVRDGEPDYGPGAAATTDEAALREIAEDTATEGRALLSDHPAVGLGARSHNDAVNMSLFTPDPADDDGITEALPVLLFEPRRMLGGTNRHTGASVELQVESICQSGFHRWTPVVARISTAPGWTAGRRAGGVELRDPDRGLWARAEITPDPAWLSAAASQQVALAVYGPRIGVRTPHDATAYRDTERLAELREAREYGMVAASIVQWTG